MVPARAPAGEAARLLEPEEPEASSKSPRASSDSASDDDLYEPKERGRAFGLLFLSAQVGAAATSIIASVAASGSLFGVTGWRICFFVAGCVSACLVPCVLAAPDPAQPASRRARRSSGAVALEVRRAASAKVSELASVVAAIRQNRTLQVITLQGLFGNIPWQAFNFLTLWLQYRGESNALAATKANLFRLGTALGGWVGGVLSDSCHARDASHGRVYLVQAADSLRLPMVYILFRGGGAGGAAEAHGGMRIASALFLIGLFAPVVGVSNRAILAEATPASARASTLAFNTALEGIFASVIGGPLVGVLAERWFNYAVPPAGSAVSEMSPEFRERNAQALSDSLFSLTIVPWTICLTLYTLVHFTFAADVLRAKQADAASR